MAALRSYTSSSLVLLCTIGLILVLIGPTHAFGAGNIASNARIEGSNWRHGDIEDTLLTLFMTRVGGGRKFSKLDVKRVYFGNWLRDYSQAVDVGTVKYVSAEAIRLLLWVLGFMSFGFATREFEVTKDRLGCYRPEEHIDNPRHYADDLDARQYDRRLRGPVDERRELSIDERNGLKNYIASEDLGITTSAGMIRDLLKRCIHLARQSKRSRNDADMFEALRLLGTATHCMEDFSAHSNYTELALIEMGERDIFAHVGRRTQINIRGARQPVYPLITGTFGGVDFLHSVCGEVSDKVTQSEIQELEGSFSNAQQNENSSMIKQLLDQLPSGLLGAGADSSKVDDLQAHAAAAQMQNTHISPKEPEQFTRQATELTKQIYPILEFHDEIMRSITEAVESIPVLPELIEQLQEAMSMFCFSLIAPLILPIIGQIKSELATGSSEIIQSSKDQQQEVFHNDNCTDPTHSMLSKDHFTNILNEPAGKIASQVLKWVVPQIVECWDDERADVDRTINRIINGVFHHPSMRESGEDGARDGRQLMFRVVEGWWREKSERERQDLRDKLSRDGVLNGRNHKEGFHDTGHGCGKPLGFASMGGGAGSNPIAGAVAGGLTQGLSQVLGEVGGQSGFGGFPKPAMTSDTSGIGRIAGEAVGGGVLGGLVGGVLGGVGNSLLSGAFGDSSTQHNTYQQQGYGQDGSHTQTYGETAHRPQDSGGYAGESYGKAEYKRTDYPSGGRLEEFNRTEQSTYGSSSGQWQSSSTTETYTSGGQYQRSEGRQHGGSHGRKSDDSDDDFEKKERKRREKEQLKHHSNRSHNDSEDSDEEKRNRRSGEHDRRHHGHGHHETHGDDGRSGYGREEESYGRQESQGRQETYGSQNTFSRQSESYGQEESYGQRQRQQQSQEYGGQQRYGGDYQQTDKDDYDTSKNDDEYGRGEDSSRRYEENNDYDSNRRKEGGWNSGGY